MAKYFDIIIDSPPDVSNVNQWTFIIRYVATDGAPNERFFNIYSKLWT